MNGRKTTMERLCWENSGRRIAFASRWQLIAVASAVALCAGLTSAARAVPLCGAGLRMNCQAAGRTGLIINTTPRKRLAWKWLKGAATTLESFGAPTDSTAYALCIYAGTSTAAVAEIDVAASATLWHPTSTAGFNYRDPHGSSDGIRNVILKAGTAGEAKAVVRGGGANLPSVPAGPLPLPVTAQLVNSATGVCFEEVYDDAVVQENDAARFKASTMATDLYVAASGSLNGRGSVAHPYRRITDAVVRARAERAAGAIQPDEKIRIRVAPGTYVGSFDPTALQTHPEYEVLPIIVNVPRLALLGSTVLTRDERGLPTATSPGSDSIVASDTPLAPNQYLLLVTRTADGSVGDGVTVDGLVFDGKEGDFPGADVFIDRVSEFRFTNNLVERSAFGVMTRLASGTIAGNLLADNVEHGSIVSGGSRAHPATILMRANRVTRNGAHGIGCAVGGWIGLVTDRGGNSISLLEPLQTTFDRNNPADVENIPDTLNVTLDGNDASDNGNDNGLSGIGIRLAGIWPDYTYTTTDPSQPVTSSLVANITGNTCDRNRAYGVVIEAGDTKRFAPAPRRFVQSLAANFEGNVFTGNDRAPALFTFTYWLVSTGGTPQFADKFAEASTYAVTDADGELVTFDYDNPVTDPLNGTVLNNALTLNGVEVPHGKSITPAQ